MSGLAAPWTVRFTARPQFRGNSSKRTTGSNIPHFGIPALTASTIPLGYITMSKIDVLSLLRTMGYRI